MSDVIESAEQLMDLLAGDDEEVPSTLIRQSNKASKHEEALIEQAKLAQLNKVEEWMKAENSVVSDRPAFISLGETLFTSIVKSKSLEVTPSVVQKLTKLALLWVKVSKSCKLLEPELKPEHITVLVSALIRSKSPHAAIQEVCGRMLAALVQCSPERLFVDSDIISAFNRFVQSWCKGTFKGNGFAFLNLFPVEFLAQLQWVPSNKPFIMDKVIGLIGRVCKKKLTPHVSQEAFVDCVVKHTGAHGKELEECVIKLAGVLVRSKLNITPLLFQWIKLTAEKDVKAEKVSGKNVRLATQILKQMQ